MSQRTTKETITAISVYFVKDHKGNPATPHPDMLRYDNCFYDPCCPGIIIKLVRRGNTRNDNYLTDARWHSFWQYPEYIGSVSTVQQGNWITFQTGPGHVGLVPHSMEELEYMGTPLQYIFKTKKWDTEYICDLLKPEGGYHG